jgi:signal peptidase I
VDDGGAAAFPLDQLLPVTAVALPRLRPTPSLLVWLVIAAAVAVAVGLMRPGGPIGYVVVAGDSMLPTLNGGDVVFIAKRGTYGVGDVVAYRVPQGEPGAGIVVIHRVVGGSAASGFVLRGDNKEDLDPWRPRSGDVVGKQVVRVPRFGLMLAFLRTPLGLSALAALVTVVVLVGGAESGRRRRA